MNLFSVFDISSAGMSVEQTRLAVAASNVANAHTTKTTDGRVYKPLSVSVRSVASHGQPASYQDIAARVVGGSAMELSAAALPRPVVAGVVAGSAPPRLVYDPGHPDADERGFVSLPAVDPVASQLELISAVRSYEANLAAFEITRSLIQRTLEIGKSR